MREKIIEYAEAMIKYYDKQLELNPELKDWCEGNKNSLIDVIQIYKTYESTRR